MFGHILQQPLHFDILIHCPGQSICDIPLHGGLLAQKGPFLKLACWVSGFETWTPRNVEYFMWCKQSNEERA